MRIVYSIVGTDSEFIWDENEQYAYLEDGDGAIAKKEYIKRLEDLNIITKIVEGEVPTKEERIKLATRGKICPHCKTESLVSKNISLLTDPPQYPYKCGNCEKTTIFKE